MREVTRKTNINLMLKSKQNIYDLLKVEIQTSSNNTQGVNFKLIYDHKMNGSDLTAKSTHEFTTDGNIKNDMYWIEKTFGAIFRKSEFKKLKSFLEEEYNCEQLF